jgi:uncharacterized protein YecT (DUF1311 family)
MRKLVIAIVAAGALAGCGSVHRSTSVSASPELGDPRFRADQKGCTQQSIGQADTKFAPTWGQTINREAFDDCMRARGWDTEGRALSPRR